MLVGFIWFGKDLQSTLFRELVLDSAFSAEIRETQKIIVPGSVQTVQSQTVNIPKQTRQIILFFLSRGVF